MVKNINIGDCRLIELDKYFICSGNFLSFEKINNFFVPKRVFYLYNIVEGEVRGSHAHKECHQILVAVNGSFEVLLDDGNSNINVLLDRPYIGLHIPPGIWATELNFSPKAICLVIASHEYLESDYVRNYNEYINFIKGSNSIT